MEEKMNILIVDDEGHKQQKVAYLINKSSILKGRTNIKTSLTIADARELLRENFYDFLILDLNISDELGEKPMITAGSDFIDEIIEIDSIKKPSNIIVLSSNEESKTQFKQEFSKKGFDLLNFNPSQTEWEEKLISKLEYNLRCVEQRKTSIPSFDVCIITAVDVEMEQLKRQWSTWEEIDYPNDSTKYYSTVFEDKNGNKRKLLIAQQSEMGMSASTYLSTKLIYQFKPQYLIMVGIAACTKEEYGFGDIIVPDTIWNYSSGKFISDGSDEDSVNTKLLPDAKSLLLDPRIRDTIYQKDFTNELSKIKSEFPGDKPNTELKIAKGPMACGAAVISDFSIVKDWVLSHSRKNIGLDMESYGVFFASNNSYISRTIPICIKSVSDFADQRKSDNFQRYSAYTSAAFAKMLSETQLFF